MVRSPGWWSTTGTSLTEELARTATALKLTRDELSAIALNAFDRAFAPPLLVAPMRAAAVLAWDALHMEADIS